MARLECISENRRQSAARPRSGSYAEATATSAPRGDDDGDPVRIMSVMLATPTQSRNNASPRKNELSDVSPTAELTKSATPTMPPEAASQRGTPSVQEATRGDRAEHEGFAEQAKDEHIVTHRIQGVGSRRVGSPPVR
jgi:hypothetical protein